MNIKKITKGRKIIATFLMVLLCMSFVATDVMGLEGESSEEIKTGYYNELGTWIEGSLNQSLPQGIHSINKTAVKTTGNNYEITLEVVANENIEILTKKAATVLVIDTSSSMSGNSGLKSAKEGAKSFVDIYATEAEGIGRYLAIVDFASGVEVSLNWIDVSTSEGREKAYEAINSLTANGGTNLQAGIKQTNELFKSEIVKNIDFDKKNTVILTDGAPTFYIESCEKTNCKESHIQISGTNYEVKGSGNEGSEDVNTATSNEANSLKSSSNVYTVCYGTSGDKTYKNGPLVSDFLKNNIASKGENAYTPDSVTELAQAFKVVSETIVSGIDGKELLVFDGLAPFVQVSGLGENTKMEEEGFVWTLKDATVSSEGNDTYYTYSLVYQVTLDVDHPEFIEGKWYPLNGQTYLTLTEGEKLHFPIPAAQGIKSRYNVTYTDGVEDEEVFTDQITGNLFFGDKTPEFGGELKREGYIFTGWTPEKEDLVSTSAVYTATWEKSIEEEKEEDDKDIIETISYDNTIPKTGDESPLGLLLASLIISAGGIGVVYYNKRQRS